MMSIPTREEEKQIQDTNWLYYFVQEVDESRVMYGIFFCMQSFIFLASVCYVSSFHCLSESCSRKRSGVPPGPAAPTLPSHLLAATALSGNYCRGDKYGDKLVLACKMYEVSEHGKRCT